jgi:hypothetical protein
MPQEVALHLGQPSKASHLIPVGADHVDLLLDDAAGVALGQACAPAGFRLLECSIYYGEHEHQSGSPRRSTT